MISQAVSSVHLSLQANRLEVLDVLIYLLVSSDPERSLFKSAQLIVVVSVV
jgi:hypothetical protein